MGRGGGKEGERERGGDKESLHKFSTQKGTWLPQCTCKEGCLPQPFAQETSLLTLHKNITVIKPPFILVSRSQTLPGYARLVYPGISLCFAHRMLSWYSQWQR